MEQVKETIAGGAQTVAHHAKAAVNIGSRLKNKIAIVTGSSSGIGRAISLAFAGEGATVVVADLHDHSRNKVEREISTTNLIIQNGGESMFLKCDVTSDESVRSVIAETVKKYGRLDIMVNNAGISIEAQNDKEHVPVWQVPDAWWDKTVAINQNGVFYGIRAASGQMMKQEPYPSGDRGWIINLSSVYGLVGTVGAFSYVASKHAVMGMTRAAALDLAAHGVHVNAINPGYVRSAFTDEVLSDPAVDKLATSLHPWGRLGLPTDVAGVALFLASEDAKWVSGTGITVDGAYTAQ